VPSGIPGDYNDDDVVDAADYVAWSKHQGSAITLPNNPHAGVIGPDAYNTWRNHFGESLAGGGSGASTVPEPSALMMWLTLLTVLSRRIRRSDVAAVQYLWLTYGNQHSIARIRR
jgi:hypothetical protein